jgi:serine/threonine protein kinase/formylglycine-generating enzyme required for sulfatase activity
MKSDTAQGNATVHTLLRINQLCDEFEDAHRAERAPQLEAFVARYPAEATALLEHLIPIELAYRQRRGELFTPDEYAARFPQLDRNRLVRLFRDAGEALIPPVLGEYELLRPIGSGGMGVVYLARHRRMNRLVALKAVPPDAPERDVLHQRFAREVEITARLVHPNVVVAFDAREDQGVSYLVTAYLEGGDLGGAVNRSGPLSLRTAIDATRAAALGLGHAHERGVIHRDVKPSNLLLDGSGRVCVADWGLARAGTSAPANSKLTAAGMVLGTIDYLAPEQAGNSEAADARSDVYSLGCVLFFLLAGRPPFDPGTVWDRLDAHRDIPAPDVRDFRTDVPGPLAELVARMLAKRPDDRPQDMPSVIAALDPLIEPQPTPPQEPKASRRALLLGAMLLAPAVGFGVWRFTRERPSSQTDESTPPWEQVDAPPVAELPLADPREYQRRWAEYLRVPVERTDSVGRVKFEFVLVPPGTFRMGSPDELVARLARPDLDNWNRSRYHAEKERLVTIRRPYYLGKTEVTFAQFELFVARDGHTTLAERGTLGWGYHGPDEVWKRGPFNWKSAGKYTPVQDHPVINTAWPDWVRFCKWLGAETAGVCRLPAESEWEFACRGGRNGLWGHGDDPDALNRFAVYGVEVPLPVGSREPNGFGLLDMHGNLSEGCSVEDPWADDPHRPADRGGAIYPVRGGRFNEVAPGAVGGWPDAYRCARRSWEEEASLSAGFRVLREIPG